MPHPAEEPRAHEGLRRRLARHVLRALFSVISRALQRLGTRRFHLADLGGDMSWRLAGSARRAATAGRHRRADPALSDDAARRRARASFREYARTTLDFLWAHDLPSAWVRRHCPIDGIEHIDSLRPGGAILVLAHTGNWDMAATIALANDVPLTTVMRPFGPGAINEVTMWARERRGLEVLMVSAGAARGLLRGLRSGRFVALLCDIPEGGPTVSVPFRGGEVAVSVGPARLARSTGRPMVPVDCYRDGAGGYRILVQTPVPVDSAVSDQDAMAAVMAAVEASVRRHPEQWYPFNPYYCDERPGES